MKLVNQPEAVKWQSKKTELIYLEQPDSWAEENVVYISDQRGAAESQKTSHKRDKSEMHILLVYIYIFSNWILFHN